MISSNLEVLGRLWSLLFVTSNDLVDTELLSEGSDRCDLFNDQIWVMNRSLRLFRALFGLGALRLFVNYIQWPGVDLAYHRATFAPFKYNG